MNVIGKKQWLEFKHGRPGHRFQDRFERNQQARSGRSPMTRFIKPFAGVVLLVAGVVFCLIPGPGLPLLLIGAGLLADVSLPVARAMDWLDVRIRNVISRAGKWWRRASKTQKSVVVVLAVILVGGAACGGYHLLTECMN